MQRRQAPTGFRQEPPAVLPERRPDPPPRLGSDDVVICYRLARAGNRLHTLTLQFRSGRLVRVRLTAAYLRPLQRAFAAAVRGWAGLKLAGETENVCRCADPAVDSLLRGVHVHGLHDAVVVTLTCADAVYHAAFKAPLARSLARDLRRLGALTPPPA
jgi:hypothetical protein